jgi:ATP-dependent DNA helicase 2 subunit 1
MMGMDLEDSSGYQSFHLTESDKMYDELKAQFSVRQSVKRAQFTIPFVLGDGLAIGIQGFSFVTETKKGAAIQVDTSGRDVREVKQILTYDDKDQARPLNPKTEMMPYFTMGGKGASVAQKVLTHISRA